MIKEEYWVMLVKKNPSFKKDVINIKTESIMRIVFQAYEKGLEEGKKSSNNGGGFSDFLDALARMK